jgi:hypothetical protein
MVMQTVMNVGRLGMFEPERSKALERIMENVHRTVEFMFQN